VLLISIPSFAVVLRLVVNLNRAQFRDYMPLCQHSLLYQSCTMLESIIGSSLASSLATGTTSSPKYRGLDRANTLHPNPVSLHQQRGFRYVLLQDKRLALEINQKLR
jgi:hypothetical protein